MTAENFIRDISEYLITGTLSDLTLNFGEKSWQIHKALVCCHSKWFQKAVTVGFEETHSGTITLKDDPEFANAIDCMVSYFYKADYSVSQYNISEPLLHAQVATIADKYDCASLNKLAIASFAKTVNAVDGDDWVAVAGFVYDHTTTELPAHAEMRGLIIAAVTNRPAVLFSLLQLERTVELFRSNAELATDLLLSTTHEPRVEDDAKHIITCDNCHYAHIGPRNCSYLPPPQILSGNTVCPQCRRAHGVMVKRHTIRVGMAPTFPCPFCDGYHTLQDCTTNADD